MSCFVSVYNRIVIMLVRTKFRIMRFVFMRIVNVQTFSLHFRSVCHFTGKSTDTKCGGVFFLLDSIKNYNLLHSGFFGEGGGREGFSFVLKTVQIKIYKSSSGEFSVVRQFLIKLDNASGKMTAEKFHFDNAE